jgi:hypothetical protein
MPRFAWTMLGQPPPFALGAPSFRFRALVTHAGRAALGGDREVALACFAAARLAAAMVPPYLLAPADVAARTSAMKQWVASIALAAPARHAVTVVIDAVTSGNHPATGSAVEQLIKVAEPQLDPGSIAELRELVAELRHK